jgi:hypothetical protein
MSKNPGRVIGALNEIASKMDALRAGALTADEAFAKAVKTAAEFRKQFPLAIDEIMEEGVKFEEMLERIKKLQGWRPERGGPEEPDRSRNIQDAAWLATQTPQERMNALLGLPPGTPAGAGRSAGTGWAAGAEGAVNQAIYIPADYSEAARQRREQRAGGWNQAAADDVISKLQQLKARLEQVFGGPVYITLLIDQEIKNIQAKVLSPDEALAFMRYVLSTQAAGLQQEALSPVSSIRDVANDLLRFAGGGALPGAGSGFQTHPTGQGRPTTPAAAASAAATVTAGIGAAVASAIHSEVTGLGVTVTRHTEAQATRVLAGVGLQTAEIRSTVNAQSAALRTIQQSSVQANRDLAEGFRLLRPISENVTALRKAQESNVQANRDLALALGRLEFSGALSPTAQ